MGSESVLFRIGTWNPVPFPGQVTLLPRGLLDKQEADRGCVTKGTDGLQRGNGGGGSSHSVFVMARSTLSKSKEKRTAAVRVGPSSMCASQAESIHFRPG